MQISNKVVVISGASGGLGEVAAKAMANAGASLVVLLGRNLDSLTRVAQEITRAGGTARSYAVDLSRPDEASAVAQKILAEVGVPDILINNAGSGQWKFLTDTSVDEIQQMMAVPYFAAAVLTREFLPGMLKRNSGHIVTISSVISRFVWPGATAYAAARWAIRGFTEALRADLYGTNIGRFWKAAYSLRPIGTTTQEAWTTCRKWAALFRPWTPNGSPENSWPGSSAIRNISSCPS